MFQWIYEKKQAPIDRRRSLDAVPVINEGIEAWDEGGRTRIRVTLRRTRGGFWTRFMPPQVQRTVKLDELGSFVFKRIDGERTVTDIMTDFREQYRLNRREAELSTAEFLRSLAERQVISLVIR